MARRLLGRWKNDPLLFSREVLGLEPWSRQADILRAVQEHPRVAVRSGHKIGKSTSAAAIALWWWATRPRAWVVMTSASFGQVKNPLWKELGRLHRSAPIALGGRMPLDPRTGLILPDGRGIVGLSTNKPERMAGISGANLLFILDEASGIDELIFEAVEGNRAGGARIVMFSNPTQTSGTYFDAFHSKREFWHTIHVSSEESPNVAAGRALVPGLAMGDWIEEKKNEWGVNSPLYAVRVRGDFPEQGSNAVIGLAQVMGGLLRWPDSPNNDPLCIGVDVARFGDDESVIFPRRGKRALVPDVLQSMDGVQVAGAVMARVRKEKRPGERPRVQVDVIGAGASVCDQLRQFHDSGEIELVEINVSEVATSPLYHLLRDQIWFAVSDWLKEGGSIPPDGKLEGELVAPKYGFDAQGRYQVEPKKETKKTLRRSPDRADALGLAVYQHPKAAAPTDFFDFSDERRAA